MKIKSLEELQDKLDEDLSWRKKELFDFKQLLISDVQNEKIFIRAGTALLCAHFEGFIRIASNYYIIYISHKNVPIQNLKSSFLALKLKKKFQECGKTTKISVHSSLFDKLEEIKDTLFFMKYTEENKIITTNSNPSSEVVFEIMTSIGLDFSPFEPKKNYIDFNLLKNRHDVVHGEKTCLMKEDFLKTFDIILIIIEQYKEIIINAAENKQYLKSQCV